MKRPKQCWECGIVLGVAGQPDTDESETQPGWCAFCVTMEAKPDDLYDEVAS